MIKIAQLLCPQRHCFMAIAFDGKSTTDREASYLLAREAADHMRVHGSKCALCGSDDFTLEIGVTRFATMDEAMPVLASCEADQLATRAYLTGPQARN